jgi:hypothetical protein
MSRYHYPAAPSHFPLSFSYPSRITLHIAFTPIQRGTDTFDDRSATNTTVKQKVETRETDQPACLDRRVGLAHD